MTIKDEFEKVKKEARDPEERLLVVQAFYLGMQEGREKTLAISRRVLGG